MNPNLHPAGPYREIYLALPPQRFDNREIARGIYRFALPTHHWICFFVNTDPEVIRSLPINERTGGIIGRFGRPELAKAAANLGIPAINVHGGRPMEGLPMVGPSHEETGRFAARQFLDSGYPHLGYYGLKDEDFSEWTKKGFVDELANEGRKVEICEFTSVRKERISKLGEAAPMEWLRRVPKPIAIHCPQDFFGHEIGFLCSQLGFRVPQDVAILGTNNDEILCLATQPALSSIRLPWQEVGFRSAQLLHEIMEGAEPPLAPVFLDSPDLVTRQSTEVIRCRDEVVEKAIREIQSRIKESLDIDSLAAFCGVSRRGLEKRFRAVLDRSPLQELNRVKIEAIKQMLRRDRRSIEQIADELGFSSAVYLSQFFHRETGMTPGTYRKRFAASGHQR